MRKDRYSNRRILIVNVNWLGDVLFSTPFIRALRSNFPQAYIACMVVPRCVEILKGNPNINDIIIYDEKAGHSGLRGKLKFIKLLKRHHFDTAFLLHRSLTRTLMTYMAGISNRIGYYTLKRGWLLTEAPRPPRTDVHRARFYLGLLEAVGLKTDGSGCDFSIGSKDLAWVDEFLRNAGVNKGQRLIVFNPGGNWAPKRWPVENFVYLARYIMAYFGKDFRICISGSKNDLKLATDIANRILLGQPAVISAGRTTIKQTAGLFKKADLVISNDSGPLHIAVAVGAKAIGLFGPTSPSVTGPYQADPSKAVVLYKDVGCDIPCYNLACNYSGCMSAITPQEVFEEIKKLLK